MVKISCCVITLDHDNDDMKHGVIKPTGRIGVIKMKNNLETCHLMTRISEEMKVISNSYGVRIKM